MANECPSESAMPSLGILRSTCWCGPRWRSLAACVMETFSFARLWNTGRLCMKLTTREWVKKAENDFKVASQILRRRKEIVTDAACFFSQQCVEKYFKARLIEAGVVFPRTHDLLQLLNLCATVEPLWLAYAKAVDAMSDYAVDFRYPGHSATLREARIALQHCRSIRTEVRRSLGLKKLTQNNRDMRI